MAERHLKPDFICTCGFPSRAHGGSQEWAPQDHEPTPMFPAQSLFTRTRRTTMPQRTTPELYVRVGEDSKPFRLDDATARAVQNAAAARAEEVRSEIAATTGDAADMDIATLIEFRSEAVALKEALEVLIECRPLDEVNPEADAPATAGA